MKTAAAGASPRALASPLMAPLIPVAKPKLPVASAILPYLKEIDANHWYTNHGLLWLRFQGLLAEHWGVESNNVALVANATIGLTLALRASGVRPGGLCLLPSWTFVASPAAAIAAGLRVRFIDVDPATWMPDPAAVAARDDLDEIAAIMIVSPFGMPFDVRPWDELSERTGIPVVIDAAAAFDTMRAGGPLAIARSPMVVSLHATKVFGIGEGGAVVCRDGEWLERFRRLTTFGFLGSRVSTAPGINAKVSEYGAAIGLAAFDGWTAARARFAALTERYRRRLGERGAVGLQPRFGEGWVTSTMNIVWPSDCQDGAARLAAEGIATLAWWGQGCHRQPAYADCLRDPLPATEDLAQRTVGLPFWLDMTPTQVDAVCDAVHRACGAEARGDAASRPRAAAPAGMPVRAQIARAVAAARSERR
ncbi:MAG TPA: DegT/DnrJ/EryC1/StrS family aminotransferase [Stellaceae bacterium]|nr:DegT/DnrJ/EryC1/StrS family aminotransferase [Stellaceae bacterium]